MRRARTPLASLPSRTEHPSISNAPSEKPASVPNSRKLPQKPRLSSGAYSAMNVAAPPYSPPVEKPWIMRSATSAAGAHKPMLPYDGKRPTSSVATDMMMMVSASTCLRPSLSPSGPQKSPPSGRTRKEIAKVASAKRVACAVLPGKSAAEI